MMMMQSGPTYMSNQSMPHAKTVSRVASTGGLNLGKKISVPRDLMMEELNLTSNRGSRMFQERLKRAERFTLENINNGAYDANNVHMEASAPMHILPEPQGGPENQAFPVPGKHSLVMSLQKTVAKKGSPDILAPGYAGPVKDIPHEKFNATVIPKGWCSPWTEALQGNQELLDLQNTQLPQLPQRLEPANYRCFNRSARPFGGAMSSKRVVPLISYEAVESQALPSAAPARVWTRPNFNRAPKGWAMGAMDFCPESNEL